MFVKVIRKDHENNYFSKLFECSTVSFKNVSKNAVWYKKGKKQSVIHIHPIAGDEPCLDILIDYDEDIHVYYMNNEGKTIEKPV